MTDAVKKMRDLVAELNQPCSCVGGCLICSTMTLTVHKLLPLIVEVEAEMAALKEPMECGHPKACWIDDQRTSKCDSLRHGMGYSLCPGCVAGHCTACEHERLLKEEIASLKERLANVQNASR